ncbi:hypothetical protein CapIbe_021856 [Capra ibex]
MERNLKSFTRQGNCFFTLFWLMKRFHRNTLLSDSGGDLYWTPFGGHSRSASVPCCLISRAWHTEGAHELAVGGVNKCQVSPKGLIREPLLSLEHAVGARKRLPLHSGQD